MVEWMQDEPVVNPGGRLWSMNTLSTGSLISDICCLVLYPMTFLSVKDASGLLRQCNHKQGNNLPGCKRDESLLFVWVDTRAGLLCCVGIQCSLRNSTVDGKARRGTRSQTGAQ